MCTMALDGLVTTRGENRQHLYINMRQRRNSSPPDADRRAPLVHMRMHVSSARSVLPPSSSFGVRSLGTMLHVSAQSMMCGPCTSDTMRSGEIVDSAQLPMHWHHHASEDRSRPYTRCAAKIDSPDTATTSTT
jgi:hypothetical protein